MLIKPQDDDTPASSVLLNSHKRMIHFLSYLYNKHFQGYLEYDNKCGFKRK